MAPMATPSVKRKWADVFGDNEGYDKQSIMDLCAAKLRYVNPARPPRRRTEVPLLRNVLIVNTIKHLSGDLRNEHPMEQSTEELSVDPGHFEGLPPLSELLTDIMLDPQSGHPQESSVWSSPVAPTYTSLIPVEPSMASYVDTTEMDMECNDDEKVVHHLLPCSSEHVEPGQDSLVWSTQRNSSRGSLSWHVSCSSSWSSSDEYDVLDCDLSMTCSQQTLNKPMEPHLDSPLTSSGPLPSISSFFESCQKPSFTELLHTTPVPSSTCPASFTNPCPAEESAGNINLTDADLELLAMTFSSRLPVSFEDFVHSLPASYPQPHTFYSPPIQSNNGPSYDSIGNQCSSYCRKDQPATNVDENSLVRVLVNL